MSETDTPSPWPTLGVGATIHPISPLGLFPDWWQPRRSLNIQVLGWSAARLRLPNALRRLMLLFDE